MGNPFTARCEGTLPRRAFLRASLTGLSTLGLADLLRLEARAGGEGGSAAGPRSGPSIIVVWLWGGPSHMETFDLKPEAPEEYRGEFRPIETNVPGMLISEHLPRLSRIADKYALIRSITHDSPGHVNSTHTVLTGYPGELVEAPPHEPKYPDIFQASHAMLPSRLPGLPQWVALPRMRYTGGAYLGESHGPFAVTGDPSRADFDVPALSLDEGPRRRLSARGRLLDDFDRIRRAVDQTGAVDALDAFQRQALTLLTGTTARDAFDLSREDPRLRDRYGRDEIGQRCLLARRLVESGVRLVTIDFPCVPGQKAFSWDDHASVWNIFEQMKIRLPVLDRSVSALIEDVHARGMDRDTMIVVMGEMSHTPKLSNFKGQPGREHWGKAMSVLLSGGGMPMGQVIGATNPRGEEPSDRPFHPSDLLATWYRFLGIDPTATHRDRTGRPIPLLPRGEPIRELA
ncbi:DUF1501 domain-containing protein [Tautonia plasticadhaerens]|uniref:DUF1501 domain-containing protein n=1 Tax=Tautonia plasticadhaerens TaxID=2527974 RepID=A0A518H1S1_9BACT|nr:DUF1501 domain-containing protein [Tautonia plasticadhaerens]QDV34788.1 hypothetical protein ElP_26840 [Tautonia plasticadhaerens]